MSMFLLYYLLTGFFYAIGMMTTFKCFEYKSCTLQMYLIGSVPCDLIFISFIPLIILKRPFCFWTLIGFLISLPTPFLYNWYIEYEPNLYPYTLKEDRKVDWWWVLFIPISRFCFVLSSALNKRGLLHKSKFKYKAVELLSIIH